MAVLLFDIKKQFNPNTEESTPPAYKPVYKPDDIAEDGVHIVRCYCGYCGREVLRIWNTCQNCRKEILW